MKLFLWIASKVKALLPRLVVVFPALLDIGAALISVVSSLTCRWWVKVLLFIFLFSLCAFLGVTVLYPYIAGVDQPADMMGWLGKIF